MIVIIITLGIALFFIASSSNYLFGENKGIPVAKIEAGPLDKASTTDTDTDLVFAFDDKLISRNISTSDITIGLSHYKPFAVKGVCMKPIGIEDGDIVFAKMFPRIMPSWLKKRQISKGMIVVIYLNTEKFKGYKMRIVDEIVEQQARTYCFEDDGTKHWSSRLHDLKKIQGVITKKRVA